MHDLIVCSIPLPFTSADLLGEVLERAGHAPLVQDPHPAARGCGDLSGRITPFWFREQVSGFVRRCAPCLHLFGSSRKLPRPRLSLYKSSFSSCDLDFRKAVRGPQSTLSEEAAKRVKRQNCFSPHCSRYLCQEVIHQDLPGAHFLVGRGPLCFGDLHALKIHKLVQGLAPPEI